MPSSAHPPGALAIVLSREKSSFTFGRWRTHLGEMRGATQAPQDGLFSVKTKVGVESRDLDPFFRLPELDFGSSAPLMSGVSGTWAQKPSKFPRRGRRAAGWCCGATPPGDTGCT